MEPLVTAWGGGASLLVTIPLLALAIFYWLLPLLIYWRCGAILRTLKALDADIRHDLARLEMAARRGDAG